MPALKINLAHWRDPPIPIPASQPDADAALAWVLALPEEVQSTVLSLARGGDGAAPRRAAGSNAYKAVKAAAGGTAKKSRAERRAVREAARTAASAAGKAAGPATAKTKTARKPRPSAFKKLAKAGDAAVRRMLLAIGAERGLAPRRGGYLVSVVGANAVLGRIARDIGLLVLAGAHCRRHRVLPCAVVVTDQLAGDVFEAALAAIQSEFGYDDAFTWFKSLAVPWVEQAIAAYKA
ncbi:uncharacterized protein LOC62_02G003085 [Vanrija pseudolonga]|uniref:Uncharacterized protein n=1 Tax=Vanrija pseudolonga TaxID=143232 RepID=A0AAF0Y543_9TREE|nr:hypothetical protein LOC62_02G003085 [Vanrija pseudolonga]